MIAQATALLTAFATSDVDAIARLCAPDLLLWGTDDGEVWRGRDAVVRAFAGVFSLGVGWVGEPVAGEGWVAGDIRFTEGDRVIPARVTMVFHEGLLAHAHYSVALAPAASDGGSAA